jgi:hypothetical protein
MSLDESLPEETIEITPRPVLEVPGVTPEQTGSHVAAGLSKTRNSGKFLSVLIQRVNAVTKTEMNSDVRIILESILLPIVARRSDRTVWFDQKDSQRLQDAAVKTANVLLSISSQYGNDMVQTFVKYHLDILMCKGFRDSARPPLPSQLSVVPNLFFGFIRRGLARAVAQQDMSLIYSLAKGAKQAWPSLSVEKIFESLAKHSILFSTHHGNVTNDILSKQIKKCSSQVFKNLGLPTQTFPTGKSCTQYSYSKGGTYALFSDVGLFSFSSTTEVVPIYDVRTSMTPEVLSPQRYKNVTLGFSDSYTASREMGRWKEKVNRLCYSNIASSFSLSWSINGDLVWDQNLLKVQAIPEPGKVRVITKGNGYLYTGLQPLQGLLIKAWKKTQFSTMLDDNLLEKVTKLNQGCAEDLPMICSGDYEAATDLVKKAATMLAFSGVSPSTTGYELALMSFLPSDIVYPSPLSISTVAIDAQPMGHPLSFPLLCVINLSVYQAALTAWKNDQLVRPEVRYHRRSLICKHRLYTRVIINGDDILFRCTKDFMPFFISMASDAGLKISQGKNYVSSSCCMINSQMFLVKGDKVTRISYLNQRLTSGNNIKTGNSMCTPTQLGAPLNDMFSYCPWSVSCLPLAFSRWKQQYFGPNFYPNWFLPVHLGGFGVDPKWSSPTMKVSYHQRRIATQFVLDPRLSLFMLKDVGEVKSLPVMQGMAKLLPKMIWSIPEKDEPIDLERTKLAKALVGFWTTVASANFMKTSAMERGFCLREFVEKVMPVRNKWGKPMCLSTIERYRTAVLVPEKCKYVPDFPAVPLQKLSRDVFDCILDKLSQKDDYVHMDEATLLLLEMLIPGYNKVGEWIDPFANKPTE